MRPDDSLLKNAELIGANQVPFQQCAQDFQSLRNRQIQGAHPRVRPDCSQNAKARDAHTDAQRLHTSVHVRYNRAGDQRCGKPAEQPLAPWSTGQFEKRLQPLRPRQGIIFDINQSSRTQLGKLLKPRDVVRVRIRTGRRSVTFGSGIGRNQSKVVFLFSISCFRAQGSLIL